MTRSIGNNPMTDKKYESIAQKMVSHTQEHQQQISNIKNNQNNNHVNHEKKNEKDTKQVKNTENTLAKLNEKLNKKSAYKTSSNNMYLTNKELKKKIKLDEEGHLIFDGFSPKISRTIKVYPEIFALFTNLKKGVLSQTINNALIDYLLKSDVITKEVAKQMYEENY